MAKHARSVSVLIVMDSWPMPKLRTARGADGADRPADKLHPHPTEPAAPL